MKISIREFCKISIKYRIEDLAYRTPLCTDDVLMMADGDDALFGKGSLRKIRRRKTQKY